MEKGKSKWQSILNINITRTSEKEKVYVNNAVIHQILFVQSAKIENNIRSKMMAEYIDKQKTLSTLENTAKYYEMSDADEWTNGIHYGLIHGADNIVDNVPVEDVVERKQIDKAIEEIKQAICSYGFCFVSRGMNLALDILKKNIGESKNESEEENGRNRNSN